MKSTKKSSKRKLVKNIKIFLKKKEAKGKKIPVEDIKEKDLLYHREHKKEYFRKTRKKLVEYRRN